MKPIKLIVSILSFSILIISANAQNNVLKIWPDGIP